MLISTSLQKPFSQLLCIAACVLLACVARATEPPITAVTFAPDGRSVVAVSQSGVQEFSWPQLQLKRTISVASANLHCVAFSPDVQMLAVGGGNPAEEGSLHCYSWPDGKLVSTIANHSDSVRSVAWVDSTRVVSASLDRVTALTQVTDETTASRQMYSGHSRGVSDVLLLQNGKMMVTAGDDQSVRVWELDSGKLVRSLNQHTKPIHSLAIRPTTSGLPVVASAAGDRTIRFWQPTIGRLVRYVRLDSVPLRIVWVSEDKIAASCIDGRVRIVDFNEVKVLHSLEAIDGWAYTLGVHPNDGSVVVGGSKGQLRRIELPEVTKR